MNFSLSKTWQIQETNISPKLALDNKEGKKTKIKTPHSHFLANNLQALPCGKPSPLGLIHHIDGEKIIQ